MSSLLNSVLRDCENNSRCLAAALQSERTIGKKSAIFVYESDVDKYQHKERYIPCSLTFFVAMITFLYLMSWTIL